MTGHKGGPPLNNSFPTFVWRKAKKEELEKHMSPIRKEERAAKDKKKRK